MRKIPLGNRSYRALVDDEDYAELAKYRWHESNTGYAVRDQHTYLAKGSYGKATILMHREIMQTPKGLDTDHINGNRLDNRRANLRICSRSQNKMNSVKNGPLPKGVTRNHGRFMARITKDHKTMFLGNFATPEQAHAVYILAAQELHGEFARTQ